MIILRVITLLQVTLLRDNCKFENYIYNKFLYIFVTFILRNRISFFLFIQFFGRRFKIKQFENTQRLRNARYLRFKKQNMLLAIHIWSFNLSFKIISLRICYISLDSL